MVTAATKQPNGDRDFTLGKFLNRSPDTLSLRERQLLAGSWAALEMYTPGNLALRRMVALASSASACRKQLVEQGLDQAHFEYILLR